MFEPPFVYRETCRRDTLFDQNWEDVEIPKIIAVESFWLSKLRKSFYMFEGVEMVKNK
jgi:hypothetical protein